MKNSAGGGALSPTRGAAAGTIDVFCGASAPSSALPGSSTRSRHWPHYAARRSKNHWPHCAQRVICAACRRCPSPWSKIGYDIICNICHSAAAVIYVNSMTLSCSSNLCMPLSCDSKFCHFFGEITFFHNLDFYQDWRMCLKLLVL